MNLIAFQGVTRNIDERRKAENALKESEKKYKLIVENTSDVIWIMDKDLKTTFEFSKPLSLGFSKCYEPYKPKPTQSKKRHRKRRLADQTLQIIRREAKTTR